MSETTNRRPPNASQIEPNFYRLYFMDRPDGHIGHVSEFLAPTDEEAILRSEAARSTFPMELWQMGRKIKRWESI